MGKSESRSTGRNATPPSVPVGLAPAIAATILIIEDEPPLRDLVRGYLAHEGYQVLTASDGLTGVATARAAQPDLVVLDLMLPGLNGIEVCRQLRTFSDAYVLMLTARSGEIDRVVGLEVGADDYLTKPFSPRELVARIRAMLRRPRTSAATPAADLRVFDALTVNADAHEVVLAGRLINLTPIEYNLLLALTAYPDRVLTRVQLLDQVWGTSYAEDDHVVDVHIANLRRKLGDGEWIATVRGAGYRFVSGR